ncbi:MAG: nucleotidyltransferase domain-containing protein [archaeon]|nr:nucleotidyltransferase domain-containing protein [archaeon]
MALITEQYAVDSVFTKEPWKKLTYRDIQRLSGKKSRSYIYKALERLIEEKIIIPEKIGKSILYGLNLDSTYVQNYMAFLEEFNAWTSKHVPSEILSKLGNKILKVTPFYILIVTGSYAKKTHTKKSDLDVVVICGDEIEPKKIYAELSLASELSIPKVHLYVFNKKQFLEMLFTEKQNYGKEFAKSHLLFNGGSAYYSILQEAIRHGFRG